MQTQNRPQVTRDTIIRFNRETIWVATGLLGTLVFAALALAFQERQRKARQAESDFFPNANLATVRRAIAKSFNSNGKLTPGPESSVDHASTETSLREIPSSRVFCARERRHPSFGGLFHYSGSSESKEYENAPVHTSSVGIY